MEENEIKTFREIALLEQVELDEKKMASADRIKAARYRKLRHRDPEYKREVKKQENCSNRLDPENTKLACGLGELRPHRVDKARAKAARVGARSR